MHQMTLNTARWKVSHTCSTSTTESQISFIYQFTTMLNFNLCFNIFIFFIILNFKIIRSNFFVSTIRGADITSFFFTKKRKNHKARRSCSNAKIVFSEKSQVHQMTPKMILNNTRSKLSRICSTSATSSKCHSVLLYHSPFPIHLHFFHFAIGHNVKLQYFSFCF